MGAPSSPQRQLDSTTSADRADDAPSRVKLLHDERAKVEAGLAKAEAIEHAPEALQTFKSEVLIDAVLREVVDTVEGIVEIAWPCQSTTRC